MSPFLPLCSTVPLQLATVFFSCAGPRPTTSFSPGWPKASAALGDKGEGTLRLCVEGSADERLRGSENLPYSGEKGITFRARS